MPGAQTQGASDHRERVTSNYPQPVIEDGSSRVVDRVRLLNASQTVLFADVPVYEASDASGSVEVAFQWTTGVDEQLHSIVNGRTALFGGWHENGFKRALSTSVNRWARTSRPEAAMDADFLASDLLEGLVVVFSIAVEKPEFGPQGSLEGSDLRSLVQRATGAGMSEWLMAHPAEAALVVAKAEGARTANSSGECNDGRIVAVLG